MQQKSNTPPTQPPALPHKKILISLASLRDHPGEYKFIIIPYLNYYRRNRCIAVSWKEKKFLILPEKLNLDVYYRVLWTIRQCLRGCKEYNFSQYINDDSDISKLLDSALTRRLQNKLEKSQKDKTITWKNTINVEFKDTVHWTHKFGDKNKEFNQIYIMGFDSWKKKNAYWIKRFYDDLDSQSAFGKKKYKQILQLKNTIQKFYPATRKIFQDQTSLIKQLFDVIPLMKSSDTFNNFDLTLAYLKGLIENTNLEPLSEDVMRDIPKKYHKAWDELTNSIQAIHELKGCVNKYEDEWEKTYKALFKVIMPNDLITYKSTLENIYNKIADGQTATEVLDMYYKLPKYNLPKGVLPCINSFLKNVYLKKGGSRWVWFKEKINRIFSKNSEKS